MSLLLKKLQMIKNEEKTWMWRSMQ